MYLYGVHREGDLTLKSLEMNSVGILHGMLWAKLSRISDLVRTVPEFTGPPSRILFGTVSQHSLLTVRKYSKIFGASGRVGWLNDE